MGIHDFIMNYYSLKWGKMYGIAPEDIKDALKIIGEVAMETDYDENDILATYLYLYHKSRKSELPESVFDKIVKSSSKGKGELVKFSRY